MEARRPVSPFRLWGGYAGLLAIAVAAFLWIRQIGEKLSALPSESPVHRESALKLQVLPHVLLALVVILVASRALGFAFGKLRQPPVIGEVVAGICLGPSLLGRFAPSVAHYILPTTIVPSLGVIAQVGVVLFMFLVGLELDTAVLKKESHTTLFVAHSSIVLPFLLGSVASLWIYPLLATANVPFVVFALFMGVSLSVTAFPVLARILGDRGIHRTPLGVIALSCAAIDDVTAWCLLAFVVSVATSDPSSAGVIGVLPTVLLTLGYGLGMVFLARPFVVRFAKSQETRPFVDKNATTLVFVLLLVSALITEAIGVHALFGAFILGAIVPHDSKLARELTQKLEDVVTILFLPAFFAYSGMHTEIALVNGASAWLICGALVALACVGKVVGTALAARAVGIDWRTASQLGLLMNTRGLMALIVLDVGLDLGVLTPKLFTMLVLMALFTTFATAPGLDLLRTPGRQTNNEDASSRAPRRAT